MPVSGSNGYRSGIVTLPNRVRIREMDSRLGLYPKIKRTGDKDRRGNDNVAPFDDRETVLFNQGVSNLLFGSLVTTGSSQSLLPYAGNNNPNGGISGTGNVIAGISDSFYMTDYKELASRKNDTENLSPFNESRINLNDTSFYTTGTLESEYLGFSSRLHDKTQIVIDISSNEQTSVGLINKTDNASNATLDTSDVKNQLMAYYNFKNKRWEKIARGINGNVTSGSLESLTNMVETAAIGFSNVGQIATGSTFAPTTGDVIVPDNALASYARPIKTFGFPFHAKYVATGSQVLKMSDYISSPFLIEKLQFHFDSMKFEQADDVYSGLQSFGSAWRYGSNKLPKFAYGLGFSIHSFFLLRQNRNRQTLNVNVNTGRRSVDLNLTASSYTANIPGDAFLNPRSVAGTDSSEILTRVNSSRDLITYSQLTTFFSASVNNQGLPNIPMTTFLSSSLFRDASIRLTPEGANSLSQVQGAEFTGSLMIESPVRITPKTPLVNALVVSCSIPGSNLNQALYLDDEFGGRSFGNLDSSSRALYNGQGSFKKGNTFVLAAVDGSSGTSAIESFVSADINTIDENSPYILFPEDEIIIGYQFPLPRDLRQGFPESDASKLTKSVFEGPAKLVLFGSQIKDNKEFHDTLNQPLTSEAIHESLHYDNPVVDQFEISSRDELSGSYLDVYRDVDLKITADSNITIQSLSTSGNSLAGSIQRFNRLTDKTQIYYDTAVPDPLALWALQTGRSVYVTSSGNKALSFGVSGSADDAELAANEVLANSNAKWFKSFAYNNSLGRVSFQGQKNNLKNTFLYFVDGDLSTTAFNNNADQYIANFTGFNFNAPSDVVSLPASLSSTNFSKEISNALMWLYGFGTGISGSLAGENPAGNSLYAVKERPRGYKYGVYSVLPIGRTAVYRGGHFGQYSDMIEQGQDTVYLLPDNTITESPVNIRFVARESDTTFKILNDSTIVANTIQSSNISTAATSSLPYFDDLIARNRGVTTTATAGTTVTNTATQTITIIADDD